ncbi:E3 ubiquitin-protein ligase TRIM39-like isoform X1 [Seriola lalandi dorsalis]|uniref:E3 ubiquitin-protein ligase TRIM39-like n=1 Tax=Seriola lalandi dorsalis TaxID=1841481 RepID=A0A3B4YBJ6_SERLL|nr:E3 ubiquitin-protein ligase TRIM39-like isoform X1 [Seriola lalandi dorsalis]XP_023253000.1 E3 ubiquitin-protein ligase TRIM39-like isoform X1 [Seriola lalandi dorsalis]XP_056227435.1 E3 ubiquitin-protein ligase TRIM39 [Seriola aureovittata]XP_056227436.1 E3 ubiquitin-protein ligase TRIM39 [Seriola aureovittata]
MAMAAAFLSEDQFSCSICLEVFNNPVSTPCGHSFCQTCISSYWDRGVGGAKFYQCPLCKESFHHRPELHINRTLKEITEQFKQMADSGAPTDRREGGGAEDHHHPALSPPSKPGEMPESVFAEMMTRFQQLSTPGTPHTTLPHPNDAHPRNSSRVNARQALQAQNSLHHDPPPPYSPPRRYSVSSSSEASLSLPLCPAHLRGLEFFCRTDNTCVCSTCVETVEHQGHIVIPAMREWHIRKSQLGIAEVELKELICEKERKVEEIHNSLREIQAAAERETGGALCAFSKLISSVERCQAEILEVIEMSRRAAEQRAQSLLRELEEEVADLRKRGTTLSQLAVSDDYILFLKTYPALSTPPPAKDWSCVSVSSELTSGVILRTVSPMMERFEEELRKLPEVCQRSLEDQSVPRPNLKTRRVQEYAADITLDAGTAHPRLIISADAKQVHCGERHQLVPDNPERFDRVVCVLAHQGFNSGRHYWEVMVGGKTDWDLGVACRSVNRKGKITVSPAHGYWFLSLRDRNDYAFRTEPSTSLAVNIRPSRIGVYVDCDKGVVSFYDVEARVLIYTFTYSFPDTIHPFFSPCTNKSGRNEAPLIICPTE